MPFNKSSLTFTLTNSLASPNPPKRGSKIGQWRPRLKCFSKERHFLFYNFMGEALFLLKTYFNINCKTILPPEIFLIKISLT